MFTQSLYVGKSPSTENITPVNSPPSPTFLQFLITLCLQYSSKILDIASHRSYSVCIDLVDLISD